MINPTRLSTLSKLLAASAGAALLAGFPVSADCQTFATKEPGVVSIPLVSRTQISPSDLQSIAENQAAIAASAEIYGYALDASYDYREIGCPLTPNHILLAYESARPSGAASRFTAVIPRSAARTGGVQIISISHFGSVPFLPADSNPHSIEVFNRVVSTAPVGQAAAENPASNPLLFNGLCYLAMIGEAPAALTAPSLNPATVHAPAPTMKFREKGSITQVVSARNSSETYRIWNFVFGRDGRLVSVEKVDHPIETAPPILSAGAASTQGTIVAAASPTAAATPSSVAKPPSPALARATPPVAENPATAPANPGSIASAGISAPAALAPSVAPSAVSETNATTPAAPATSAALLAATNPPVAVKVVPRPKGRLIANLPLPPSRFIPAGSLPYPPQAPAK